MKPTLHPLTRKGFEAASSAGSGSYLFHGPVSRGKLTAARSLARSINCLDATSSAKCARCSQFDAGNYPDLIELRPDEKISITIDQIRQLGQALSLSPYYAGGERVVIIDEAYMMTVEAQNALLKLLEEPPAGTRFILIALEPQSLLPTVRSRVASLYFGPIAAEAIAQLLVESLGVASLEAGQLANLAEGAPGVAVSLASDPTAAAKLQEMDDWVRQLLSLDLFGRLILAKRLADSKYNLLGLSARLQAKAVQEFADGRLTAQQIASHLAAFERFRTYLRAKVTARVAIERLMLEL